MELLPFNRIRALSGAAPSKRVLLTATKKVCLICSCVPKIGFQDDNLHVIIFDLNSNPKPDGGGFVPVAPVLRIKCDFFLASCVLNSILYLFDGYDGKLNREGKAVYTYDLSGADPTITGPIMEKDELDRTAPPMNGIKLLPVALPTPDNSKILVFSAHVMMTYLSEFMNFELYDSISHNWHRLPELPNPRGDKFGRVHIRSYAFLDKSVFFIKTSENEMFTIDLNSAENWEPQHNFLGGPAPMTLGRFYLVGGCLCLDENGAYDIHKQTKLEIPLPLEDLPLSSRHRRGHATLLDRGGGEPSFCFLGSNLDGMHPRVFIDVHDFDLAQFHPSNSRSHQFVQGAVPYLSFSPAYLFPIRD